ncbi:permease [Corynebacterium yonathiae]|uniref:Permease n=1 Tax=Corynebacterium yonathiae TaxID=2913504 RepID=A0A9X3LXB2_9CORY|nr:MULTISPECIES: permease [Corynebacterium]MCZ9295634.1 permease [Corynebacterium yonathiae]MDK2582178.1 permease [Corynebacterium sp. BWA136]
MSPQQPFSQWMPNYKFAYIAAWVAVVVSGIALVIGLITGGTSMTLVFSAIVCAFGIFLIVVMPRWALEAEEEQAARRRARAAREELRRS